MENWKEYLTGLIPLPDYVRGINRPVRSLGTDWILPGKAAGEKNEEGIGEIGTGEVDRRDMKENEAAADEMDLRGTLTLPEEFAGHPVYLRFERAGCMASLYADGRLIREHYGSYTAWEALLPEAGPDRKMEIRLVLKGDRGKLSPYEKAGIFGDIKLIACADSYVKELIAKPQETGVLLDWKLAGRDGISAEARLMAPDQTECAKTVLPAAYGSFGTSRLAAADAELWSPLRPALYELELTISDEEGLLTLVKKRIGLRSLKRTGNELLWNGEPVKLKGLCYREPLIAEKVSVRRDLELFREAGVNYLRALYYPFSEELLELCDEMGFFTEQMPAVSEVDQGILPTQNAPEYREKYLTEFGEVMAAGLSHVSVLIWLLGSECTWGDNFRQEYRLAKAADPIRPVNFHYPMTIPEEEAQPDIWSVYYVSWKLPLDEHYDHMTIGHTHGSDNEIGYATGQAPGYTMPVLHDAFAHIPCFNRDEIDADPGIHEFWGESIVRFVKKMEHTKGTIGGAVMAAVDESGAFDGRLAGYRYGVLDAAHRPKPEYHHLAMAYLGRETYEADLEEERLETEKMLQEAGCRADRDSAYQLEEDGEEFRFSNGRFRLHFSKKTCLISGVWAEDRLIIREGPYPQTTRFLLPEWEGEKLLADVTPDGGRVMIRGHFGNDLSVQYELKFTVSGRLSCEMTPLAIGRPMPHEVKANIGVDPGGLNELGIAYLLPDSFDRLVFRRRGLWKEYPAEHIGRSSGTVYRRNREDYESMKHSVLFAKAEDSDGAGIVVLSDGSHSVRMQPEPAPELVIDDRDERLVYKGTWYLKDDYSGNYKGTETESKTAGDSMEYTFTGTGITVYGPIDIICGKCDVYVDNTLFAAGVSRYPEAVDFPGMSRGYEKRYRQPAASVTGLMRGTHTIRIEVRPDRAPGAQGNYVPVDYLIVEDPEVSGNIRMIINNDYNYARLVRGNYMRNRVIMQEGVGIRHEICLCAPHTGKEGQLEGNI